MPKWIRRIHILATIGGGFVGLAVGLATLVNGWGQSKVLAVVLVLAYCVLCLWSIALGLWLVEGEDVGSDLRVFYFLQIPWVTTPVISFHAGFGAMLYLGVLPNGRNIQAQLGADWNTAFLTNEGWFLAINVVPLVMLWLARRSNTSLERTREG